MGEKKKLSKEMKTAIKLLTNYETNRQACISLQELLDENNNSLQGVQYTGMPSSGTIGDPTAILGMKKHSIKKRLKNAQRDVKLVEGAIKTLKDEERLIILRRYIHGLHWEKVAEESMFSRKQTYNIAQKSLKKITTAMFGSA